MATPETLERREVLRLQPLAGAPSSADEAARTVEMVAATETPVAGLVLRCRADAVEAGPAVVPALLNHSNNTAEMAGRLLGFRFEQGRLIVTAQFTDAPAAEAGWQLARAGCAVSVGASYQPDAIEPGRAGEPDVVTKWRLREVSLVPVGADPLATTRAAESIQTTALEGNTMTATPTKPEAAEAAPAPAPSAAEIKRARKLTRDVERVAEFAPAEARDEIRRIAESQGIEAARAAAIEAAGEHQQRTQPSTNARTWCPSEAGANDHNRQRRSVWDRPTYGSQVDPLAEVVKRHWSGTAQEPLAYALRRLGFAGRTDAEVLRAALSTSDLPYHLQGMGNRQSLAAFAQAPQGIRVAAAIRQLNDYRAASTLDIGLVGTASEIREGGEIQFRSISESGISYKPKRKGLGFSVSPESQANDDQGGLQQAMAEMPMAMLESEARDLVALFEGHAQGAPAPDGARLFATAHNNVVSTALSIASIGDAVAKLRNQTSVGGRFTFQTPGTLLCAPGTETTLRQLLSDQINAAEAANVNPWRSLRLEVDPLLSGAFVYLLADGNRKPLELGRLTPAPVITSEIEFSTGFFRTKCEHSFGCVVVDYRPVVRLSVAAA